LPAPLGALTVNDWSGPATNVSSSGTREYDLPALVPAGSGVPAARDHHEDGAVFCTASARLRIAGGPFDTPLIWVGLALARA
jgi:hypothetical protein